MTQARVRLLLISGTCGLLLAAFAGAGFAAIAPPPIKIVAREFAYEPKEVIVRAGEMVFSVQNAGAIEHNFLIDDAAKKTVAKIAVISPGETEQVRVTLRVGTYAIYCDLPGHREAGMAAPLRVRD